MKCRILKSGFVDEIERKINEFGAKGWRLLDVMVFGSQLVAVLTKEEEDDENAEGAAGN